jgi:hypothetical protein
MSSCADSEQPWAFLHFHEGSERLQPMHVRSLGINGMGRALPKIERQVKHMRNANEKGAAGYIAAWALGVPVVVLVAVFLLRGCT